jgi:hypothetical protein
LMSHRATLVHGIATLVHGRATLEPDGAILVHNFVSNYPTTVDNFASSVGNFWLNGRTLCKNSRSWCSRRVSRWWEKWVVILLLHPVNIKLIFSCYELPIALAKLPNIEVNLPFSSCTKVALLWTKVTLSNIKVAS